jgi:hypothetical protein
VPGNDYLAAGRQSAVAPQTLFVQRLKQSWRAEEKIIMRSSIKVSLTGLLIGGALAFSAAGADAMGTGGGGAGGGGNGGNIVGGNPQAYGYSGGGSYQGGGYQANTDRHFGHTYHNSHGGYGPYHGGY